jgi:hypothetical protein
MPFQLPYDAEREVTFQTTAENDARSADHVFALKELDLADSAISWQLNIETWTDDRHGVEDQITGRFTATATYAETDAGEDVAVLDFTQAKSFEDFVKERIEVRKQELAGKLDEKVESSVRSIRRGRAGIIGGVLVLAAALTTAKLGAPSHNSADTLSVVDAVSIAGVVVGFTSLLAGLVGRSTGRFERSEIRKNIRPELERLTAVSLQAKVNGVNVIDYSDVE